LKLSLKEIPKEILKESSNGPHKEFLKEFPKETLKESHK
jgi:hypothetical protein